MFLLFHQIRDCFGVRAGKVSATASVRGWVEGCLASDETALWWAVEFVPIDDAVVEAVVVFVEQAHDIYAVGALHHDTRSDPVDSHAPTTFVSVNPCDNTFREFTWLLGEELRVNEHRLDLLPDIGLVHGL